MQPVSTEDISIDAPPRPLWRALRDFAVSVAVVAAIALIVGFITATSAHAQARGELRIGYQKSASLFVLQKAQGTLEKRLAPLGFGVKWVEFPAGPQLLEGAERRRGRLSAIVGEAPPIFAQAAGAKFLYIGYDPAAPRAEAILVTEGFADQVGGRAQGQEGRAQQGQQRALPAGPGNSRSTGSSSATSSRSTWRRPTAAPPSRARSVDAWAIWDPFQAAAEKATGARVLADGTPGVVNNHLFYLGERVFVAKNPKVIQALFEDSVEQGIWLKKNLAPGGGAHRAAPEACRSTWSSSSLRRYEFNVKPITREVAGEQQKIADTFFELKLIPKPIKVSDAVVLAQP